MVDVVTSSAYEGDDPLNNDSDGDEDADGKQFRQVQRVKLVKPSDAVTARAEHEFSVSSAANTRTQSIYKDQNGSDPQASVLRFVSFAPPLGPPCCRRPWAIHSSIIRPRACLPFRTLALRGKNTGGRGAG